MKPQLLFFTLLVTAVLSARVQAQLVNDGATNILSNVTNSPSNLTVGTNGSFTLLVLSNNASLLNTATGVIGRNASAQSNEVRVAGASANWTMGSFASLYVGSNGTANRLTITGGGTMQGFFFGNLGQGSSSTNNSVLVADPGSLWSGFTLFMGGGGRNQLTVSNGATVWTGGGNVGLGSASNNLVTVTGTGSLWTNNIALVFGSSGNRAMVSDGGGLANINSTVGLDVTAHHNTVWLTDHGSSWTNSGYLRVGDGGVGNQVIASNGATVYVGGNAVIGTSSPARSNAVTVTGQATTWIGNSNLYVGSNAPFSRLVISDGARLMSAPVVNSYSIVGYWDFASNCVALVTDPGTVWSNGYYLSLGISAPNNQLIVSNGASVHAAFSIIGGSLFQASNNVVTVTGPGSLMTTRNGLDFGSASSANGLLISEGGALLNGGGCDMGTPNFASSNHWVTVTGSDSMMSNRVHLIVGDVGPGHRLTISNGGFVTSRYGVLGETASSSNNFARVLGPGSVWSNQLNLTVGSSGRGNQLLVSQGGQLFSADVSFVGETSDGRGNVATVTGAGSFWGYGDGLRIGHTGNGNSLVVSDGASVGGLDASIGENAGASNNLAVVTGSNSTWTNQFNFRVGSFGSGNRLVVEDGGRIANDAGFVGVVGGRNEVHLRGPGTLWTSAAELVIGDQGMNNLLVISNGAAVVNTDGNVGFLFNASNNAAVVTGAGSMWSNADSLYVGRFGPRNQLIVSNGATVFASTNLFLGEGASSGSNRIVVGGGTLLVTNASSSASLDLRRGTNVFNAGLIDADRLFLTNNRGFFEFNGGTLITRGAIISNGVPFRVGAAGSTPAIWDLRAGGSTVIAEEVDVGYNASLNQLFVTNGASATNYAMQIGVFGGGLSNTVTIAGLGSRWTTASLHVGALGSFNSLFISNGATMTCAVTALGGGLLTGGEQNQIVVTGADSSLDQSVDLTVGYVGPRNRVIVSNGATMRSTSATLGVNVSSFNNLTVVTDAGSVWSNAGTLFVGYLGAGNQLIVSNNAVVSVGEALYVGFEPNSLTNQVIVDGGSLFVTNATGSGVLEVRRGTGVLNGGMIAADILRMTNGTATLEFNDGVLAIKSSRISIGPPLIVGDGVKPAALILAGDGTHDLTGTLGLIVSSNATLTGNGTVLAQLQILNGALLSPGASIGKISLSSAPFLSGAVAMEISKSGASLTNDQIQVTGTVTYGGTLTVTDLGPTPLAKGDRFKLFDGSAYAGAFTAIALPPLPPGLSWINNLLLDGSIEVFAPPLVGAGFALSFDGTNDAVVVPHDSRLNAYQFIVTAWINTTQSTGEVGIVNKYVAGSSNGWHVGLLNGEVRAWYMRDHANRVGDEGGGLNGGPVNHGTWHHVAFTVDAAGGRLYVDGFLRDAMNWTGTPGPCSTTQGLHFGRYPGATGGFFRGELEETALWSSATITASELRNNLDRSLVGSESGLVSYHRFNEGTGNTAGNAARTSGSLTDGTLQNGVTWIPGLILRPAVLTRVATAVSVDAAELNGVSNPGLTDTRAWFEWGTTTNYGSTTPVQLLGSGGGNTNLSQSITGLTENLTYHFRAVASNSAGVSLGADKSFVATGTNLLSPRVRHTATLLPDGKVLVVGGRGRNQEPLSSAEIFDPVSRRWAFTSAMSTPRFHHTATLLPNGKVLVAGGEGQDFTAPHSSAELFDPVTETWTLTGSMQTNRYSHTATMLFNGKLLVAGGLSASAFNLIAEIYDPATGSWTPAGPLLTARYLHTASLLPDGNVLIAGGLTAGSTVVSSAELFDPVTKTWTNTGLMTTNRYGHTATLLRNGKVLVIAGRGLANFLNSAELYDPLTGNWAATGSMLNYRFEHTATLLPDGKVFASGLGIGVPSLYNPLTETWADVPGPDPNSGSTATLLINGSVLVAGGVGGFATDGDPVAEAEVFVPTNNPSWSATAPMANVRGGHTATLLSNALVLVASFGTSEVYHPSTGLWTNAGALATGRTNHTATLLANGQVLAVGGQSSFGSAIASAELYTPSLGTWTNTGSLASNRVGHTATLLGNGKVLVAGGFAGLFAVPYQSAELYDPASGSWTNTGAMNTNRYDHSATLLPNGKVLVAGGSVNGSLFAPMTSTAELYDPASGTWTAVAPMATNRSRHIAVLLSSGKVLVAGGLSSTDILAPVELSAELFDPNTGTWEATGQMTSRRRDARATVLSNGKVLVTGGRGPGILSSSEFYDPGSGTWTAGLFMGSARSLHTSTLLADGKLLVTGGYVSGGLTNRAELFDTGLLTTPSWRPEILTATLNVGGSLALAGTQFRGLSGGSGGNGAQDSPTDYPIVQLRRLDNEQMKFVVSTDWSANSFASAPVSDFPPGWAMVTVYVNGIPGDAKLLNVAPGIPTAFQLTGMVLGVSGDLQFSFTNTPGANFTVLASTNASLALSNWTGLGSATEIAPGQYQFSDSQATNNVQRYYRVRWP